MSPIRVLLVTLAGVVITGTLTFDFARVHGSSMRPTYCEGDVLLTVRPMMWPGKPESLSGKVVIAGDPESMFLKRVVAIPGDGVAIKAGRLEVNGQLRNEPYVCPESVNPYFDWPEAAGQSREGSHVMPSGQLFLLGDSRAQSRDSIKFGPLPANAVMGIVVGRLKTSSNEACKCVKPQTDRLANN